MDKILLYYNYDASLAHYEESLIPIKQGQVKGQKNKIIAKPVLNLKFNSTVTPKKEWLRPASEQAVNLMQRIFNREMDKL